MALDRYFAILCKTGDVDRLRRLVKYMTFNECICMIDKWQLGFNIACEHAHMNIIDFISSSDRFINFNIGLAAACAGGHMHIVSLMIQKGANAYRNAFNIACQRGHMDVIKFLLALPLSQTTIDYNNSLDDACNYNQIAVVTLLIDQGLRSAAMSGSIDLVNFLIEKGGHLDHKAAENACIFGHTALAEFIFQKGILPKREHHSYYRHVGIVKLLSQYAPHLFDMVRCFIHGCIYSNIDIVKFALEHDVAEGLIELEKGLEVACINDNLDIVKYLLDYGVPVRLVLMLILWYITY